MGDDYAIDIWSRGFGAVDGVRVRFAWSSLHGSMHAWRSFFDTESSTRDVLCSTLTASHVLRLNSQYTNDIRALTPLLNLPVHLQHLIEQNINPQILSTRSPVYLTRIFPSTSQPCLHLAAAPTRTSPKPSQSSCFRRRETNKIKKTSLRRSHSRSPGCLEERRRH